jgi:cysteine-rich repeat protein
MSLRKSAVFAILVFALGVAMSPTSARGLGDPPICGDDSVNQPGEECDGTDDGACPSECYPPGDPYECRCPFCGDGIVGPDEECDDGNNEYEDGCSSECVVEYCGDGILQEGLGEECDDGNNENGDGCEWNCVCHNFRVPAVSAWGVVVLALLLLTIAKIRFGRRRLGMS